MIIHTMKIPDKLLVNVCHKENTYFFHIVGKVGIMTSNTKEEMVEKITDYVKKEYDIAKDVIYTTTDDEIDDKWITLIFKKHEK